MAPQDPAPTAPARARPAHELGRAWIGPALVLAGAATLVRVEIRAELATRAKGVPTDWAHWSVLGDWPAEWIAAGILSAAATVVVWGVRGPRRLVGCALALLLLTSAFTGWPLELPTYGNPFEAYSAYKLGALVLAGVLPIPLLAAMSEAWPRFKRRLSAPFSLAACALLGLGGPGYVLWQRSLAAPEMKIERVLASLGEAGRLWVRESEPQQFVVPAGSGGPLTLRLQAFAKSDATEDWDVRLELSVDGQERYTQRLCRGPNPVQWGALEELEVRAGERLNFSVQVHAAPGAASDLRLGFRGLRLQEHARAARTRTRHGEPSLLLITLDSLRSDRLSCYGYKRNTSPAIDRLAQRGTLFENAFSTSSWIWPSLASICSGLAPDEHGLLRLQDGLLDPSLETLAEHLQASGFSTAAISCSPRFSRSALFDQGFESFDQRPVRRPSQDVLGAVRTKLEQLSGTRFFLHVHLADCEAPRAPQEAERLRLGLVPPALPATDEEPEPEVLPADPSAEYTRLLYAGAGLDANAEAHPERLIPPGDLLWLQDQYDASVASVDSSVGLILDQLRRLQLLDSTLVVLTGDHGEELLEHGLLGHAHGIGRELVQVPLILAGPGIAEGQRITTEVSNRHVGPSVCQLLGTPMLAVHDTLNLLQADLSSSSVSYQTSHGRWHGTQGILFQGSRADGFVVHSASNLPDWGTASDDTGALRIFSSAQDPGEWSDLSGLPKYLERARVLQRELEARRAEQVARRRARAGSEPR